MGNSQKTCFCCRHTYAPTTGSNQKYCPPCGRFIDKERARLYSVYYSRDYRAAPKLKVVEAQLRGSERIIKEQDKRINELEVCVADWHADASKFARERREAEAKLRKVLNEIKLTKKDWDNRDASAEVILEQFFDNIKELLGGGPSE